MSFISLMRDKNVILLLIITIAGTLLRFYNFSELPLTHDELSAFYRLNFNSLSELIEYGIKVDGHPAGVQIFLYYWINLFGTADWVIKLPFLVCGSLSIIFCYAIGKKWFGVTSGLLFAAFIATLQFPIMYSQYARPYASGMFFCLWLVYEWSNFVFDSDKPKLKTIICIILSACLCFYNHHFSMLFAIIVGATGFVVAGKNKLKTYIIIIVSILALYIPHISILKSQLAIQGLDWLGKPDFSFTLEHLSFIFHHSFLLLVLVILIVSLGLYQKILGKIKLNKKHLILALWFVLPLTIGYLYSIYAKPVLNHSVLLFSFPFLILLLASLIDKINFRLCVGLILSVMLINVYTLINDRDHYFMNYNFRISSYAEKLQEVASQNNLQKINFVSNDNPEYVNHYLSKIGLAVNLTSLYEKDIKPYQYRAIINNLNAELVVVANIPLELLSVTRESYPYQLTDTI